ncbi:hypothetical protein ASZ90_008327 [hydrocarbon metagenome]|uniref:Uncharacterized protein n=1 Tax=hydrocarbon metagenome TaxID=938273 RepID=A0A0W8FMN8_9ZZZZ
MLLIEDDIEVARRRLRRRILYTLRTRHVPGKMPTTPIKAGPTKIAL